MRKRAGSGGKADTSVRCSLEREAWSYSEHWAGSSLQLLEITKATVRTEVFRACVLNHKSSLENKFSGGGPDRRALSGEDRCVKSVLAAVSGELSL